MRHVPARSSRRQPRIRWLLRLAAVDTGAGSLFIVKNYEGDVMNFEMAAEMACGRVATVVTDDDVAVETSTYSTGRRGVAGTLVVEKIVGAAAEKGSTSRPSKRSASWSNGRTRSMGVALTSCTVPAAGKPTFELGDDEMEMGVGIHGEPGRRRVKLASAVGDRRRRWSAPFSLISHRRRRRTACCSSTASAGRRRWSSI